MSARADRYDGPCRAVTSILLALLLLAPSGVAAQVLVGRVVDDLTDDPIPFATALLIDSADVVASSAVADAQGHFLLHAPKPGRFRVYADRLGYDELTSEPFQLEGAGSMELEVRMVPRPLELDSLVVTVKWEQVKLARRGFYRRRSASQGYFFDADALNEWREVRLTDVLRQVPGVLVASTSAGGGVLFSRRMAAVSVRGCRMKVVLDGFKLDLLPDESVDEWVNPANVVGIEVYPAAGGAGAPAAYRGSDAYCGIVMIWTR